MLTVAIAGRPNVGKSTLFNRLTGLHHALTHDQPGITRDRREGEGRIGTFIFRVFDTAGLDEAEEGSLSARMTEQSLRAVGEADVTLLVVDGRAGITATDAHFAKELRKRANAVVVVVNKAEGTAADAALLEAYRLGMGEPVAISAAHGEGLAELYDAIVPFANEESAEAEEKAEEAPLQLAIIGRPNAGKSTLINKLLGQERLLTGPEAGITRDAIAVPFAFEGRALKLVDTAGMRRKANIDDAVEKMAVSDTIRAVQYAHVVILLTDAANPLEKQDLALANLVEREGRALVIGASKWDAVRDKQAAHTLIAERIELGLPQLKGLSFVPVSGAKGTGLTALLREAMEAYARWNTRVSTGELNRFLEAALDRHPPPMISGRRIKIRYMTQNKARPPSFTLFCNTTDIPDHYLRYLTHGIREAFGLPGVPLRLNLRKPKNPYDD